MLYRGRGVVWGRGVFLLSILALDDKYALMESCGLMGFKADELQRVVRESPGLRPPDPPEGEGGEGGAACPGGDGRAPDYTEGEAGANVRASGDRGETRLWRALYTLR